MNKFYTTAVLSGAVLAGAAFGPSIAGAQTDGADESSIDMPADATFDDNSGFDGEGREGRGGRGGRGMKGEAVAEALGLSQDEIRQAVTEGQTIADLAASQGLDIDSVIDALVADATEHVEEHLEAGDITDEEASERLAAVEEKITERVNTVQIPGDCDGRRGDHGAEMENDDQVESSVDSSGSAGSGEA